MSVVSLFEGTVSKRCAVSGRYSECCVVVGRYGVRVLCRFREVQ